jgi:hypothetical protein
VIRSAARILLILAPLATTATRLHGHTVATPGAVTNELTSCLRIVRIAAERKSALPVSADVKAAPILW